VFGCSDETACNYDANAGVTEELMVDPLGAACSYTYQNNGVVCNPADCADPENCDCVKVYATNCVSICKVNDELNVCGGDCAADNDNDLVCDYNADGTLIDPCVGTLDDCGICNGSATGYTRTSFVGGCTPGTFLDSEGNNCRPGTSGCHACTMSVQLDAAGIPIVPNYRDSNDKPCNPGSSDCTDSNDYSDATTVSDACNCYGEKYDALGNCGGNCEVDADNDNICDRLFDGTEVDEDPNSVCEGTFDAVGECDGTCQTDADQDQLCDDLINGVSIDQCLDDPANVQDICGICDGPGYPAGFCDCAGVATTDALDVCGGNCLSDYDEDNICDETMEGDTPDPCVGEKDICGVCGGESSIYTRNGDECIPGTFADADGVPCTPGTEGCVGCTLTLHRDASGVPCPPVYVNASGEACYPGQEGCTATYPNCTEFLSCDCWGHEYDVQGNCNGGCASDSDGDGICDYTVSGIQLDLCISETGLDAIGVCDGNCVLDEDGDGICDLDADGNVDDTCSGILDVCDDCNGTGPDFGYDCDGLCLSDVNNNDICDALEMMIVEESLEFLPSGGNSNATLDHVKVNTAFDKFTYLHEQMADNLSAGSLNGVSPKVTLEQSITSHGDLEVLGLSTFDDNIQVAGNLTVSGSVNVSGNATVGGVTHSNNGLQADNIDNLGYFQADGNVTFNDEISVYGATTLKNITHARKQLQVFEENTSANSLSTGLLFSVSPTLGSTTLLTGKLHSEGNLYANEEAQFTNGLNVRGFSVFESVQAENLNVTGATTMTGDLKVQTDKFKVNHSSGNANLNSRMVVQGNMTAHTLKGLQNFEILGTTVARTGVETPSMIARGNLIVGEKSTLGMNLHVSGSSQFKNELHLEGPFTQYNTQPGANLYGYNGDDPSLDATCAPVYTSGEGYDCNPNASPGDPLYYADCAIEYPSHCRVTTWGEYSGPSQFSISNSGDINLAGNLKPLSSITARDFSFLATLTNPNAIQISAPSFKLGSLVAASNSNLAGTTNNFTGGIDAGTVTSSGNIVLSGTTSAGLTHEMGIVNVSNHYNLRKTILYGSQSGGTHAVDVKTTASPFVAQFINNATSNQAQANSESPSSNIGGVRIKLKGPYNQGGNLDKYVVFKNSADVMTGRINIETREQRRTDNSDYKLLKLESDLALAKATWGMVQAGASFGVAIAEVFSAGIEVGKYSGFTQTCVGNGACQTIPIISFIASSLAGVIVAGMDLVTATTELVPAGMGLSDAILQGQTVDGYFLDGAKKLNDLYGGSPGPEEHYPMITVSGTKLGVAYESGGADFAEWMPRQKGLDPFPPGSIVGWHEDGLSNNTVDAVQSFAISTLPIVLGNAPKDSKKADYEKVALMGQTPIYVAGFVETGDFIVPAGDNKGYGIAKGADEITRLDFKEIVGVAWESKSNSGISKINCAVGLNNNELHKKFDEIELETRFLKEQSEALKEVLLAISNGNNQEIGENLLMRAGLQSPELRFSAPTVGDLEAAQYNTEAPAPNPISLNFEERDSYKTAEITLEIIEDQFNVLTQYAASDEADNPFAKNLRMIEENPALKEILLKSVQQTIQSAQEMAESRYTNRSL
jgi:cytoskeletal protein CcmA (bactofilin family)